MESTVRWAPWLLAAMFAVIVLVLLHPPLATWLPEALGY
jgi:TRAP-type C4-dicarboxylate transport system permease large subunit